MYCLFFLEVDSKKIIYQAPEVGNGLSNFSGICNKPEPALCGLRALAQYCKHEQYKTRCCKSCRAFEMRGTKTDDVKDVRSLNLQRELETNNSMLVCKHTAFRV